MPVIDELGKRMKEFYETVPKTKLIRRMPVAISLDCYDELGFYREPYWEIYPYDNGDIYRCKMDDVENLLKAI